MSQSPNSPRAKGPSTNRAPRAGGRTSSNVEANLRQLARGPLDARAAKRVVLLLRGLASGAAITSAEAALLAEHAALFSALGVDREALTVARRAVDEGGVLPSLASVAATHSLVAAPGGVELRLRSVPLEAEADALRVISAFMRGQLARAVDIARKHDSFVDLAVTPYVYAAAYAAWASALLERPDEAMEIVSAWDARHARAAPRSRQFMLRSRGWIVGLAGDDEGEIAHLEEAAQLCAEDDLGVERAFVDVELGLAALRAGDEPRAASIARSLPPPMLTIVGIRRNLIFTS